MSKKIYIGVNGAAKEVDPLYVSVGGSTKKISKVYVGVDGVAKQAYPETVTHKWNRYNVNTTYYWDEYECIFTYVWNVYEFTATLFSSFSESYMKYSCSGEVATDYHIAAGASYGGSDREVKIAFDSSEIIPFSSSLSGTYYASGNSMYGNFTCSTGGSLATLSISGNRVSVQYSLPERDSSSSSYGVRRGSLIKQVSSSNIYAYPNYNSMDDVENGAMYYYERTNNTIVDRGSYSGSVSSSNRNAYPDNGRHNNGSYWYIYRRSSQSRGSANGSVTSTNRSQYPDNGVSGSYWYVYAGTI